MEGNSSDPERRSLIRHPDRPASESGTSDALAFGAEQQWTPDSYGDPDEATVWAELETKKRSAEYHLGQVVKYRNGSGELSQSQELARRNERRVQDEEDNVHKDQWRLKVEHDKAVRDLIALQCVLNALKSNEMAARSTANAVKLAVICSALFSAAYFFLGRHANRISYAMAEIVAFGTGYGMVYSAYRLCYLGLRALAIGRCRQKVRTLDDKVRVSAVDPEDCESLRHNWFRILDWFRVDDWPGSERTPANSGSTPSPPVTMQTSGYVIDED